MLNTLRSIVRELLDVVTTMAEKVVQVASRVVTRVLQSPAAALGFVGAFTGALFLFSR